MAVVRFTFEETLYKMSSIMGPMIYIYEGSFRQKRIGTIEIAGKLGEYDPNAMLNFTTFVIENRILFEHTTCLDVSNLKMGDLRFGNIVSELKCFPHLQNLVVSNNGLTDASVINLCHQWPKHLQQLDMSANAVTDTGFVFIVQKLHHLSLDGNINLHSLILVQTKIEFGLYHPIVASYFSAPVCNLQRLDLRQCRQLEKDSIWFLLKMLLPVNRTLFAMLFDIVHLEYAIREIGLAEFERLNQSLVHVCMPVKGYKWKQTELTRYLYRDPMQHIGRPIDNNEFVLHLMNGLNQVRQRKIDRYFHAREMDLYQYSQHPFYMALMSIFLCNEAYSIRLPMQLLLRIVGFLKPAVW